MKNIKIPEYFNSSKKNPAKRLAGSLLIIWHATAKKVKLFFIQLIQPLINISTTHKESNPCRYFCFLHS